MRPAEIPPGDQIRGLAAGNAIGQANRWPPLGVSPRSKKRPSDRLTISQLVTEILRSDG
jgi:hypothetical protein